MIQTSKEDFFIKIITAQETHAVRHPVLRSGRPIEDCIFDKDELDTTFHLGLFHKNKLSGVVTYLKNGSPLLSNTSQYQLRGMAVLEDLQGHNLGTALTKHGETILRNLKADAVWCNAREIAVPFYKKNGFEIIGEPFHIPKIGLHFTMYKLL
ncbi:GNAT family N-acetyltransferase [Mangrovimonas sp. TPBH4]|uniref:GNAT family N-acetyltransferase n=1 Tax=Mangrovimonas sp. TPBH4 TaxID=1645914 RepID=UPI000AE74EDE|nr:GNAT family N-acetyltransferase [Mangrovimonas sp. TPBH4]